MTTPELALAPLSLYRPAGVDLIRAAAEAGYERVGLRLCLPGPEVAVECADPAARRALKEALEQEGVGVFEVSNVELVPDFDVDPVRVVAEAAAELGARYLQVVSWDPDRSRAADHLGVVGGIAADNGLAVGFEFMSYSAAQSFSDARWMLASAGPLRGGIILDTLHLARSGGDPDQLPLEGDWLAFLQLCDAGAPPAPEQRRPEALTDRLSPGQGTLPLRRLLARLDPGPVVSVEAPCASLRGRPLAEQAAVLRQATIELLEGGV
ncbi:MAG: sugar phosphate isomerase/epimerase [Acidimicrobiaceae bacterium]|nr:sugar phosphate isomerase/epimerase [Acidimicrobiaceae bacterium]